jgi:hypothetical protein
VVPSEGPRIRTGASSGPSKRYCRVFDGVSLTPQTLSRLTDAPITRGCLKPVCPGCIPFGQNSPSAAAGREWTIVRRRRCVAGGADDARTPRRAASRSPLPPGPAVPRHFLRGPERGLLASGPGMTVAPWRTDEERPTWGRPGPGGAVGDADEGSGHRPQPARRPGVVGDAGRCRQPPHRNRLLRSGRVTGGSAGIKASTGASSAPRPGRPPAHRRKGRDGPCDRP